MADLAIMNAQMALAQTMHNRAAEKLAGIEEAAGRLAVENVDQDEKVWEVAEGLEAIFLRSMLESMRKTVFQSEDSLNSSNAQAIYRSMLDEQVVELASKRRSFGLGKMIHDSLVGEMVIRRNS